MITLTATAIHAAVSRKSTMDFSEVMVSVEDLLIISVSIIVVVVIAITNIVIIENRRKTRQEIMDMGKSS